MRPFMLLITAACVLRLSAQELVPNGGLEQVDNCPAAMGALVQATGWLPPTLGSTDLFNACQGAPYTVSVPANLFGHQPAHTGAGYAGFIAFSGPENTGVADTHEYLSHALAAPLVPGEAYAVEFWVSLADISKYAVNDLGALFSVQAPHRDDMLTIVATPQVTNSALTMLADTSGWMRIHGCLLADSAYAFITIGNFHTGATTAYATALPASAIWFSYYLVDDVSVRHLPRPDLGLGPDTTICGPAVLSVADLLPGADYLWSTGGTGPSITVEEGGLYTVQAGNAECSLADTVLVQLGVPVSFALPADTVVDLCATPNVLLVARPQPPDAELLWSTGEATPTISVNAATTYLVHGSAAGRCDASATITVIDTCGADVYAPNAFTPDGDGINDRWRPVWSANVNATLEWSVYDRWGQALFSTTSMVDGWDGTAAGAPVPCGSYVWRGRGFDPLTGRRLTVSGEIVLIR